MRFKFKLPSIKQMINPLAATKYAVSTVKGVGIKNLLNPLSSTKLVIDANKQALQQSMDITKKTVSVVAQNKILRMAAVGVATYYSAGLLAKPLNGYLSGIAARKERQAALFPNNADPESPDGQAAIASGAAPEPAPNPNAVVTAPHHVSFFDLLFGRR